MSAIEKNHPAAMTIFADRFGLPSNKTRFKSLGTFPVAGIARHEWRFNENPSLKFSDDSDDDEGGRKKPIIYS